MNLKENNTRKLIFREKQDELNSQMKFFIVRSKTRS